MHGPRKISVFAGLVMAALVAVASAQDSSSPVPSGLATPPTPPTTNAPPPAPAPLPPSPVIWAENPDIVQRFAVDGPLARKMVDDCLLKLTSAPDLGTAWRRLGILPTDVVGIKITTMGGELLSTHRPIVQAICDGLQSAGVPPSQIIIWDKEAADMRSAGYIPQPPSDSHVGIAAVFPGTGYDTTAVYKNGLLGTLIWGDNDFVRHDNDDLMRAADEAVDKKSFGGNSGATSLTPGFDDELTKSSLPQTSTKSYIARLVTTTCTKIINVPVLTDNPYVGINGCMASLALAASDNNRRFQGDPTYGDPAICEILSQPYFRRKVVVNILDALIAQYAGGPRFDPQFTKSIGAIYVSRDPVAIDSIVLKRLEAWRAADREGKIDPIGDDASHVHTAPSYKLGTDDPSRIQLVKVQ